VPVLRNALSPRRRSESRPLSRVAQNDRAGAHAPGDRVLVVAPSWVGDAILSEPLFARIRSAGKRHRKTLVVADWNAYSRGKPWFREDGLHLTTSGALGLARLLRPLVLASGT